MSQDFLFVIIDNEVPRLRRRMELPGLTPSDIFSEKKPQSDITI